MAALKELGVIVAALVAALGAVEALGLLVQLVTTHG
jgi:hypothetical protein